MRKSVHSEAQARLQALLRQTREQAGLRQLDVADHLGKPQSFVAKYEGGERRLDVIEFIEVTRALQSDPVRLLTELIAKIGGGPMTGARRQSQAPRRSPPRRQS